MAQKHIDMNQAKQIQQLSADGVSIKEIVRRTGISRKTVRKYLRKIESIDHAVNSGKTDPHSPFQIDPLKIDFKKVLKKAC
jgi:DNA invertase Pin-like site-specific DNA recombinase